MNEQIEYWNGPAGQRWVTEQAARDALLRPFGAAALDAAAAAPGESVVDVGCGCGESSFALAELVGASGRVVGIDASAPMLARARERSAEAPNLTFVAGDASSAPLGRAAFDLLFSRFGVMFFPDPAGAFGHLRSTLRPDGRLTFVCWQALAANPWAAVPFEAAAKVLGRPEAPPPDAPGPFSFGDPTRVRRILEGAGFRRVELRAFDSPIAFGASGSLEEAAREMARLGPAARLLEDRGEDELARAVSAIREALPPHVDAGGTVRLPGTVWIVTARATE
jgi:SAM-dependent methyltransferase